MTYTIKAIETSYAGCLFRSKLEARWAVFFDALGVKWEHEPEGFETSAGRYLPDFRITITTQLFWFEVKPPNFIRDDRHTAFATEGGNGLIIARGMARDYDAQFEGNFLTMIGDRGDQLPINFSFWRMYGGLVHYQERAPWDGEIDRAYTAALSARFGT